MARYQEFTHKVNGITGEPVDSWPSVDEVRTLVDEMLIIRGDVGAAYYVINLELQNSQK